ncbi:MAG: phosphohydrolase [Pyramidobacter sp.]
MSFITTFTGLHIDPLEPDISLIRLEDIAHALSRLCRANGHLRGFYSVAQHCLACEGEAEARGETVRVRLACLLHDAAEAYMSDLTRPVKARLPQYSAAEERLLRVIWRRFAGAPLSDDERRIVADIDDDMMSWEFHCMMAEDAGDRWRNLKSPPVCRFEPFDDVEARYAETAVRLLARCEADAGTARHGRVCHPWNAERN